MHIFITQIARIIKVILISSALVTSSYGDNNTAHTVEDLSYGVSLFHFFQGKYFSAISDILIAEQYKSLNSNDKNSDLLLGSLYLSYGLHHKSASVFYDILNNENKSHENEDRNDDKKDDNNNVIPLSIRDRAWFHLGKNHYEHGFLDDAEQAFTSTKNTLSDEHNSERLFILSNIYVKQQKLDKAAELIDIIDTSIWKNYAYFNVGTSFIRANQIDKGINILSTLANYEVTNKEQQIIKDKALLALAYTKLKIGKPAEATKLFQTVRLNYNESTKALLGIGWSLYKQKQYSQALIPWLELASRAPSDPSVQEALISIPYVFEQINNHQQALHQYEIAISSYTGQLNEINKVIEIIKNGDFIRRLKLDTLGKESATPFSILFNINAKSNQYLLPLVTSNIFHEALKTYQQLTYLNFTLNHWEQGLPALKLILNEKTNIYNSRYKESINNPYKKRSKRLQESRNKLANKIKTIELKESSLMLANSNEQRTLNLLSKVAMQLNKLRSTEDLSEEIAKLKLLKGLIYWEITTSYKTRIWETKINLKALDKALYTMHGALYSLSNTWKTTPNRFKDLSLKIKDKSARINGLKIKMTKSLQLQETYLQAMAMKVIETHRKRLKLYHDRALFAKARIYDSLIVNNDHE